MDEARYKREMEQGEKQYGSGMLKIESYQLLVGCLVGREWLQLCQAGILILKRREEELNSRVKVLRARSF